MNQVEIHELSSHEILSAACVLSRGMRDNPIHVQAFGANASCREDVLRMMFVPVLRQQINKGMVLGAYRRSELVGVMGMVSSKHCQPTITEKVAVLPALIRGAGLRSSFRVFKWTRDWSRHDTVIPHWHLGPVAVDRYLQGQGIGSALLSAFCRQIDAYCTAGYLETDKPENVIFYKRFGFTVVDEHLVLGTKNWFMIRHPVIKPI